MKNWLFKTNNRYLKTSLISFSIWLLAIVINLVLFAAVSFLQGAGGYFWQGVGLVLLVSAVYSFPGIVVFWLVFLIRFCHCKIFRILLITAMVTSFLPVLCMLLLFGNGQLHFQSVPLFAMAVLSAVVAVVMHRRAITYATSPVINETELDKNSESLET